MGKIKLTFEIDEDLAASEKFAELIEAVKQQPVNSSNATPEKRPVSKVKNTALLNLVKKQGANCWMELGLYDLLSVVETTPPKKRTTYVKAIRAIAQNCNPLKGGPDLACLGVLCSKTAFEFKCIAEGFCNVGEGTIKAMSEILKLVGLSFENAEAISWERDIYRVQRLMTTRGITNKYTIKTSDFIELMGPSYYELSIRLRNVGFRSLGEITNLTEEEFLNRMNYNPATAMTPGLMANLKDVFAILQVGFTTWPKVNYQ